jgi:hypothetical protein
VLALAKSLLLLVRYLRRIATSLEHVEALYKLELQERFGIVEQVKGLRDQVEVSYMDSEASYDPYNLKEED